MADKDLVVYTETNLPASYEEFVAGDTEVVDRLAGEQPEFGNLLPMLKINYDAEYVDDDNEDADPIALPRGHYKLTYKDDAGTTYTAYCKNPLFRPYLARYRYTAYDNDEEKYVLSSTIFADWGEAVVDDRGQELTAKTYKRKTLTNFPDFEDKLKCNNVLYGTVTMPNAKDMFGKTLEVKDVPCVWYSKGASFMVVADAFEEMKKRNKKFYRYNMKLGTTREKSGSVTYFPATVEWQNDDLITDQESYTVFVELFKKFLDTVTAENDMTVKQYEEKRAKMTSTPDFEKDFGLNDSLDDMVA